MTRQKLKRGVSTSVSCTADQTTLKSNGVLYFNLLQLKMMAAGGGDEGLASAKVLSRLEDYLSEDHLEKLYFLAETVLSRPAVEKADGIIAIQRELENHTGCNRNTSLKLLQSRGGVTKICVVRLNFGPSKCVHVAGRGGGGWMTNSKLWYNINI